MISYIIRRILYSIPILCGVNIIVFLLFFIVNTPEQIARADLGDKNDNKQQVAKRMNQMGLDKPKFINSGWNLQGSMIFGNEKSNQTQFKLNRAGNYRVTLEPLGTNKSDSLIKSNQQAPNPNHKISVKFDQKDQITLSSDFNNNSAKIDQAKDQKQHFYFSVKPSKDNPIDPQGVKPNTLTKAINFDINYNIDVLQPSTRVIIEFDENYGLIGSLKDTILYNKSIKMLWFEFGKNKKDKEIKTEIWERMWPSLMITLPALVVGTFINIIFAMMLAVTRGTLVDYWGIFLCVIMMSISSLFYIIGGQFLFGTELNLTPISGYDVDNFALRFILLPVAVLVVSGVGVNTRFYRTIFLEEINRDYVRTAKAKGMKQSTVLFVHTLKNAMIPILTSLVVQLPLLLIGSLLIEKFFAIPGLGQYTIDAIYNQDFSIVQAMVMLGATLYVLGLLLTDISYTIVDPRVRL